MLVPKRSVCTSTAISLLTSSTPVELPTLWSAFAAPGFSGAHLERFITAANSLCALFCRMRRP